MKYAVPGQELCYVAVGYVVWERHSAPVDTQLTLGWRATPVSGVLNLGNRTKNAGGYGHRTKPVYFMVKLLR